MPEENKFAPPPTNIVIRTMEKDLQALQEGGGELPQLEIPEEMTPPPPQDAFLQQTPTEAAPQGPAVPPPPPPIDTAQGGPAAPMPAPEIPAGGKKSFLSKPLLLAFGGVVGLAALGAVGYFVVVPIVRNAFAPAPVIPSPIAPPPLESPSPPPSPSPSPVAPTITLAKPADGTIDLELGAAASSDLFAAIATQAAESAATGTFKILNVKTGGAYLSAAEVLPLLFDHAPMALVSDLERSYALFLYWVRPAEAHLGAYFSLNPIAAEAAGAAVREWESSLAADAGRFFLGRAPGTMQGTFRDGAYQNIPLRFAVFDSGLAIDHAVIANTFVFTTHRDSMFEAIRRLAGVE
jgi:hypothetical protein